MRLRLLLAALTASAAVAATSAQGAPVISIFSIAGGDGHGFAGDGGLATRSTLNGPAGLVVAPDGSVIVADTIDQRIRRIDPSGRISTIAGNGTRGASGDGGPATQAQLQDPSALALAADGTLFVADTANSRIRAVRPDGTISTVAGNGGDGFSGDGGPAVSAQISAPSGLALDNRGDLFFSDTANNRVRVIHPNGIVTTLAGTGVPGFGGDGGPAPNAQLNSPAGLALASDGSLLIADSGNNRVRRVDPTGRIATVAGNGGRGSNGDGGPATAAELHLPADVAAAPDGGFFVAEQAGDRIRRVDSNGIISRVAGTGAPRFGGDGHAAISARLNAPQALELLPSRHELLVADSDNNRVRYVTVPGQSALLAIAPRSPRLRAALVRRQVSRTSRALVVRNVPIRLALTKSAKLTLRIGPKHGRRVATVRARGHAGVTTVHLPRRLRVGKHRLTKNHYVVGVTASTGTATATGSFVLVVK